MKENIIDTLNKNIKGAKLVKILEDSFVIEKMKEKIKKIVDGCEEILKDSKNIERFLVHGDVKLESIHTDKEGKVSVSRLVHATSSENEALALIYDFGNLRGRAAGKPELQSTLDKAIIDKFTSEGKEEMGKAIVKMANLRTTLKFIGYIESGATEFNDMQKNNHDQTFIELLEAKENK